ncbi:glycosyl transferase [Gemmatimonadetes bacterium T265]|nr:glycosyl transferase [Gemmatimonadetes bacterium T265]
MSPSTFRSLRLALVCDWYPPRVGGIETHVRALAEQLVSAGHEVDVITTAAGCRGDGAALARPGSGGARGGPRPVAMVRGAEGVRVRRLRLACIPHFAIAASPRIAAAMTDVLAEGDYDLVHAHASVLSPLAFAGVAAAHGLGLPAVLTQHSVLGRAVPLCAAADRLLGWTRWRVLHTAVSPFVADEVREAAARAGRTIETRVLPNGIHPRAWAVARRAPGTPGEFHLASVMRLAGRKRPRALVEIAAMLRAQLPPGMRFRLRIAGDGPERAAVERDIRRFGLDGNVELLGWQPREAIRALYAESDVFVLPSILESFGIAALEARCAGLPVLAMRNAGPAAFIRDGIEGLLADDDTGMAAGLLRLATDDRLRASIARHNRTTRPAETWDAVLARHEAVYADARRMAHGLSLHTSSVPAATGSGLRRGRVGRIGRVSQSAAGPAR